MPVMNVEAVPCSAAGAPKVIAQEDVFPVAVEVIFRMAAGATHFEHSPATKGIRSPQAQNSGCCRISCSCRPAEDVSGGCRALRVRGAQGDYTAKVIVDKMHYHKAKQTDFAQVRRNIV
jgi:hypothetical protein